VTNHSRETWHGYECASPGCPERGDGRTGVVLDVRLPGPPREWFVVVCPTCATPMRLTTHWPALPSGHGSRGDWDLLLEGAPRG